MIPRLTHWGRVTHICVKKLWTIGSDNDLSPGRRQAIIWNNVGILFIWHLETNFSENQIEIITFSFKRMRLKMSSGKWRPFCLSLNAFNQALTTVSMSLMYFFMDWTRYFVTVISDTCSVITSRPRQVDAISQTTFSNAFSSMKMLELRLKFHCSLFPTVQLTIFQQWFR